MRDLSQIDVYSESIILEASLRIHHQMQLFRSTPRQQLNGSPLDEYELDSYAPVVPSENVRGAVTSKSRRPVCPCLLPRFLPMLLLPIWLVLSQTWIIIAWQKRTNLFPENSLHPVRHSTSLIIFEVCAHTFALIPPIFCWIVALIEAPWKRHRHQQDFLFRATVVTIVFVVATLISSVFIGYRLIFRDLRQDYYDCKGFPVTIKLYPRDRSFKDPAVITITDRQYSYAMVHEKVNDIYYTNVSERTYEWASSQFPHPQDTGIYSLATSFNHHGSTDTHGSIIGTCANETRCLEGRFWVSPDLVFEYNYTDPVSSAREEQRLASNEGTWFFGKTHRPVVSLWKEEVEVFRATGTSTFCSAGDQDLETSVVPLGLMMIAERKFKDGSTMPYVS
jgi:hypothetical protein